MRDEEVIAAADERTVFGLSSRPGRAVNEIRPRCAPDFVDCALPCNSTVFG